MFIDTADITVTGGRGGDGAVAFHREKYITAGGPDGGDGGHGGHVIFQADRHMATLMDFRYKRKFTAGDAAHGTGGNCTGKNGKDLVVRLPLGTLIRDRATGRIVHDLSDDQPFVVARGGRGGWGNARFATPTRQAPRFAKSGLPGESLELTLELKLLADVGLCGFPNVGKSTLLSVISNARPKIAGYHFTTLAPNLGLVRVDEGYSFVAADIPGLIEGAASGAGLGHDFLRHVDRCRLLVHVVDVSGFEGRDPVEDFDAICAELAAYNPDLAARPQIVCANKCDIVEDREPLERLRAHVEALGHPLLEISAATRMGVDKVIALAGERLRALPPILTFEQDFIPPEAADDRQTDIRRADDKWMVTGVWIERLMRDINFGDYESRMYFDRVLRRADVFARLEEQGIEEGDTVNIYGLEFEYTK